MNVIEPFVRQAMETPEVPALQIDERIISYGNLLSQVQLVATRLVDAGVRPGDLVAVPTGPGRHVIASLAIAWIGAASVDLTGGPSKIPPLAARFGVNHLFHSFDQDIEFNHPGARTQGRIDALFAPGEAAAPPPLHRSQPRDCWRISLSSGTTGMPKGIRYGHQGTILNVILQGTLYPAGPGDRVLIGMTPSMGFAAHTWLRCLYAGACAVFLTKPDAESLLRRLHASPVRYFSTVPGTLAEMVLVASRPDAGSIATPPTALQAVVVGGAKLSRALRAEARKKLCGRLNIHYGAGETHLVAILDPDLQDKYPASSGRLLPWVEAQAVSGTGELLPAGQGGLLRFRSPLLALGYVQASEAEQAAFREEWFYSSDFGSVSDDGIVRLQGRNNDVLNLGGVKLARSVVEDAVLQDEAISACSAVEIPANLRQPALGVAFVGTAAVSVETLVQRCADLSPNFRPVAAMRVESLPHNAAGKVDVGAVQKMLAESIQRARRPGTKGETS